jgi:hypothetical protein
VAAVEEWGYLKPKKREVGGKTLSGLLNDMTLWENGISEAQPGDIRNDKTK